MPRNTHSTKTETIVREKIPSNKLKDLQNELRYKFMNGIDARKDIAELPKVKISTARYNKKKKKFNNNRER